jgi:hypothetical protein
MKLVKNPFGTRVPYYIGRHIHTSYVHSKPSRIHKVISDTLHNTAVSD